MAGLIIVVAAISALDEPSLEKMEKFFDISKYVLGVLLPVIGAWVGTVLAFYLDRAASKQPQKALPTSYVSYHRAKSSKPRLPIKR